MNIKDKIYDLIQSYDTIIIHRHQRPDMDAIGSQYGLYLTIKENYPSKNVYAVGDLSDAEEVAVKRLQLKYPGKQVYKSYFPQKSHDMESPAGITGDAIYVLKDRRKNGKYRVLDYILIQLS